MAVLSVIYVVGFLGSLASYQFLSPQRVQTQIINKNAYNGISNLNNFNILKNVLKNGGNAKLMITNFQQSFQKPIQEKKLQNSRKINSLSKQMVNHQSKTPIQILVQISRNFQALNQNQIQHYIQQKIFQNIYMKQYMVRQKMIQLTKSFKIKSNRLVYNAASQQQQLQKLQQQFNKVKLYDPNLEFKGKKIQNFEQYKQIILSGGADTTNQLKQIFKYSISPYGIRNVQNSIEAGKQIMQDFFNPTKWISSGVNLALQTTYATTSLTLTGLLLGDVFPISQRIYQGFVSMVDQTYFQTVPIMFIDSKSMPQIKMFYDIVQQMGFDSCRTIILHGKTICLISQSLQIDSIFTIKKIRQQFLLGINIPLLYSAMSQQNVLTNQWILTTIKNIQTHGSVIISQMIGQNIFKSNTTKLRQMESSILWQDVKQQYQTWFQVPIIGRQTWRNYYDRKNNNIIQYLKITSGALLNYTYNNFKLLSETLYASYQAFWNLISYNREQNSNIYKGLLVAGGSLILVYKSGFDNVLSFLKFAVRLMFFPILLPIQYLIWPLIRNFSFKKNQKYDMSIGKIQIVGQKYNNQKYINPNNKNIYHMNNKKPVQIKQNWAQSLNTKRVQLKDNWGLTRKYKQIGNIQCDKQSTINKKIQTYINDTTQSNDKLNKFKQILMSKLQVDKKNTLQKLKTSQGLLFPFIFSTRDLPHQIQQALFCLKNNIPLQQMPTIPKQISSKQGIKIIYNCIKNGGNQITKLFKAFQNTKIGNLLFDKGISLDAPSIKKLKDLFYKLKVYGQYLINFEYLQRCAIRTTKDGNFIYYISMCPTIRFSLIQGSVFIYQQKDSKLQVIPQQSFNGDFLRKLAMNKLNQQSAQLINSLNKTLKNYKTQKVFKQWLKAADTQSLPTF